MNKLCPFCKGDDVDDNDGWYDVCKRCGAAGPVDDGGWNWNTRPIENALRAEIETLKAENEKMRSLLKDTFEAVTEMDSRKLMFLRWNLRDMELELARTDTQEENA